MGDFYRELQLVNNTSLGRVNDALTKHRVAIAVQLRRLHFLGLASRPIDRMRPTYCIYCALTHMRH